MIGDSEMRGGRWKGGRWVPERVWGSFEGAERGPRSTVRQGDRGHRVEGGEGAKSVQRGCDRR